MITENIEKSLTEHLFKNTPQHDIRDVYFYACLPAGKFFRPSLVWSICQDLNQELFEKSLTNANSNHSKLSSSIELHHTYTLLHDDLPCMDDDQMRRGRPCTHIKFGEWKALLAGDGLLNISYQLLAKIKHPRLNEVIGFFSWANGPKGLIHGQTLDLSHEMTVSFKNTLRTHELKTARLIQSAVVLSAALALPQKNYETEKTLWKYSRLLGINFQLIDDLSELAESPLSQHEKDVNPWLKFPQETYQYTLNSLREFENLSKKLQLKNTDIIIGDYYKKMLSIITPNRAIINQNLKNELDLDPVVLILNSFGKR